VNPSVPIGEAFLRACVLEVSAPKAGNVHPWASFEDMNWTDFVRAASACRPIVEQAPNRGVGPTVLAGVRATRRSVGCNTNLGTLLLIAPLAAGPLTEVLAGLSAQDAAATYAAIAEANPGGLGDAPHGDVRDRNAPPPALRDAMALAADRDDIAAQYVRDFADVRALAARLEELTRTGEPLDRAIVTAQLERLASHGDSLIRRKCAEAIESEARRRAAAVGRGETSVEAFDAWLRAEGHRRNPGATADLIAAALFMLCREGRLANPAPWSRPPMREASSDADKVVTEVIERRDGAAG